MQKRQLVTHRLQRTFAACLFCMLPAVATGQTIPTTLGWYELPNTKIRSVCPDPVQYPSIQGVQGCAAVTSEWGGAALDDIGNRLYITGGGHSAYAGNEIYYLDLNNLTVNRLNEPSTPVRDGCTNGGTYADGKPVSRHTYNQLAYIPSQNTLFVWGGSQWQCGYMEDDTWLFSFASNTWSKKSSANGPTANFGRACTYDKNSGLVYCHDDGNLRSYNPQTNTWVNRSTYFNITDYKTSVIDPLRKRYYLFADGATRLYYYDISSSAATNLSVQSVTPSGCTFVGNWNMGVDYDSVQDKLVVWNGGNSVQLFDANTNNCTTVTYSSGPTALPNGTFTRFRYIPNFNLFVVCNSVDANCYTLRLSSGTGSPSANDTTPPSSPTNLFAGPISSSQINISWTASTDNVGVTGYRIERCLGSGCNTFSEIGTSATPSYSDTALAANTTYSYRLRASDGSGNLSSYSGVASAITQTSTSIVADQDFQARCGSAGVIICGGFDNTTADIVKTKNLFPASDNVYRGALDTSVKASGSGSLRFTLPAGFASANMSGYWLSDKGLGVSFGQNSTFYVQFQQRFSPEMFSNFSVWDSYWKQFIIFGNSSCGALEISQVNLYGQGYPTMYTNCGSVHMYTNLSRTSYTENTPLLIEQGASDTDGYNCQYGNTFAGTGNGQGCFLYPSNKWITFYYKVHIGNWNQANSTIEAWVALDGQPYKKWINVPNMTFTYDSTINDVFKNIMFTPYMTSLSKAASVDAYTWYDELIVSIQPIAAPGPSSQSATPPAAPTGLTLQ